MDPSANDWHEYAVTASFDENYAITPGGQAFDANVTLEDVQLALLQQSAPEWRDAFTTTGISADNPVATTGSFTDTFGPGQVTHVVSDDGLVIINQTLPGHPFHPGIVVRTVVENNGAFDIISYGIGNTSFEGAFGSVTAFANQGFGMVLFNDASTIWSQSVVNSHFREGTECFLAGTMITMADGSKKPIEQIRPDDWVLSMDQKTGQMVPGKVTRTFQNEAKIILDFHGTFVTPGHVYYRADSKRPSKFEPLIDILRDDGIIQHQDGALIRASTGCEVGSADDEEFFAFKLYIDEDGKERVRDRKKLRFGTRWMLPNGNHFSMREYLDSIGVEIIADGPHAGYARWKETDITSVFAWVLSDTLPNPEDFILARSQTTLEDIYHAGEWEGVRPSMPAPMILDGGPVQPLSGDRLDAMRRNEPLAMLSDSPSSSLRPDNNPQTNRRQRKAAEAKARQAAKNKRPKGSTLH